MIGSWRWNLLLAWLGALLTLLFSISSNILTTVLLRSLYAFVAFFITAYPIRIILSLIIKPSPKQVVNTTLENDNTTNQQAGKSIDVATPEQSDELNQLLKDSLNEHEGTQVEQGTSENFKPLNPPQFVSAKTNAEPEELAKAIRHLTKE
ncbi:hypothetical protein ACFSTH_20535 [Paenibacillus yanchengensis]|uniref:Uncharacterized protein n=1 Tax=Paenibacillus yanchengensis TaxID=2035833 RepID=A0ABW4YMD0_9BACL